MARRLSLAPVQQARRHIILQKFFVYEPGVHGGDELGGLRVREEDGNRFVLASPLMVQYWIDQGILGDKPVGEISENQKRLLAQVTRGRSESDDEPERLPKYSKAMQSGSPSFALTRTRSASARMKQRRKGKANDKKPEPPKKPEPQRPATFTGTPAE